MLFCHGAANERIDEAVIDFSVTRSTYRITHDKCTP